MIISPPLLKAPQAAGQSDDDWIDGLMPVQNASDEFPVLDTLAWHGGYHLPHTDDTPLGNALRAIADGIIVYARPSSGPTEVEPIGYQGKTDDGCVVIQHTTEIGEGVEVIYYSIYMHLTKSAALEASTLAGKKVYRKQEIGAVGKAKGQNMIHMEIICDQANLVKLTGRSTTKLDLSANAPHGRTTVVYGDIHFYLPKGTKFYAQKNTSSAVTPSETELYVTLRFDKGDAQLTTRKETAVDSGIYIVDGTAPKITDYEYDLYKTAGALKTSTIAHSAVYELLRFGRILNTATESSNVATIPHWHQVYYNNGASSGYVNLNAPVIKTFSDGDFPHWMGWSFIDDDASEDSQCNSPTLTKWLDTNGDGKNTHAELTAAVGDGRGTVQAPSQNLGNVETLKRLSKTICNFPTEWDQRLVETQYNWLTKASDANPDPLTEDDYKKFKAHVTALSFWDKMQASAGGTALPSNKHWHFHPREFIKHFRKCGWLSEGEFKKIYPAASALSVTTYRTHINKVMEKYYVNSSFRISHFFGQAAVETNQLRWMAELFNGDPFNYFRHYAKAKNYIGWLGNVEWNDGGNFRGRGMKQMTGRDNYSRYWVYRGWLDSNSFTENWWRNLGWWGLSSVPTTPAQKNTLPIQNATVVAGLIQSMRAPVITNTDRVMTETHTCIDTAGWFWAKNNLLPIADKNDSAEMTRKIRGDSSSTGVSQPWPADAHYPDRVAHTQRILAFLGDQT